MEKQDLEIYLCRHGETEWSLSGQHTGMTDMELTPVGRKQAEALGKTLRGIDFTQVWTSPLRRAVETCRLAGMAGAQEVCEAVEWDYGVYEGLTREQIWKIDPGWELFLKGAPGGESVKQVVARAEQLIERMRRESGRILLFSHGHFLRALTVRWLGLEAEKGRHFVLSVGSVSVLGYERKTPVLKLWNGACR